jgi:Permease family
MLCTKDFNLNLSIHFVCVWCISYHLVPTTTKLLELASSFEKHSTVLVQYKSWLICCTSITTMVYICCMSNLIVGIQKFHPIFIYYFQKDTATVISTMLLLTGISTILHTFFGTRLPLVQGSSFAYLAPALVIMNSDEFRNLSQNVSSTILYL